MELLCWVAPIMMRSRETNSERISSCPMPFCRDITYVLLPISGLLPARASLENMDLTNTITKSIVPRPAAEVTALGRKLRSPSGSRIVIPSLLILSTLSALTSKRQTSLCWDRYPPNNEPIAPAPRTAILIEHPSSSDHYYWEL